MTAHPDRTDGEAQTETGGDVDSRATTRRDFMRATAAGAGALAFGATVAGTAAAQAEPQIPTPKLEVDGNLVVDPEGNTVKLRGLNIADPKLLDLTASVRGKTAIQAIDFFTDQEAGWYPRLIRLPIEPGSIAELTPVPLADYETGDYPVGEFDESDLEAYCEEHLDAVVDHCEDRGVYCIVDYHRHWGDGDQPWDDPALDPEVTLFWDFMAARYGDRDHVLFELYNEPTEPGMWGDPTSHWAQQWTDWVTVAQPWLETIREHTDNIVLLGSPGWTTSPEGILLTAEDVPSWHQEDFRQFEDPADNLAMTYHIYPAHDPSKNGDWEGVSRSNNGSGVNNVYEEYPLFVTEFGWDATLQGTYTYGDPFFPLEGTTSGFGESFMDWLESSDGIHWTAWCGDPIWKPVMIERPFTERDQMDDLDAAGDPFDGELLDLCPDPPCEWAVLGDDVGDYDTYAGGFIKDTLAELRNDGVPSGEITPPEPGEPDPPTGLEVVSAGETSLELAWTGDADATGYAVSVDGTLETEVTGTSATLEGLEPDTTYEVGVTSLGADGFESEAATVTATTAEEGGPDDCAAEEIQVGENCATDVDGDGLYRDVDGTGTTGSNDVVQFFRHVEDEAVQANPDAFDFNESGGVGFDDVVALFGQI